MDAEHITQLLRGLGSWPVRPVDGWVSAPCPFAAWTHRSREDRNPSFAISIDPSDQSSYHCFSCHRKGQLYTLLWALASVSGRSYTAWHKFVQIHDAPSEMALLARLDRASYGPKGPKVLAGTVLTEPAIGRFTFAREPPPVLPETELDAFDPLPRPVLDYLRFTRRLTPTTLWAFGLRWSESAARIAIPVRDMDGSLVGITGRQLETGRCRRCMLTFVPVQIGERLRPRCPGCGHGPEPKYMHTKGFKRDFVLFGEHRVRRGGPVILVEGHFDAIYLQQQGYPAVAVMGTSLSSIHLAKITQHFTEATIFFDDDDAGIKGAQHLDDCLSHKMRVKQVLAAGHDPDELSQEVLTDILGPPDARDRLTHELVVDTVEEPSQ